MPKKSSGKQSITSATKAGCLSAIPHSPSGGGCKACEKSILRKDKARCECERAAQASLVLAEATIGNAIYMFYKKKRYVQRRGACPRLLNFYQSFSFFPTVI